MAGGIRVTITVNGRQQVIAVLKKVTKKTIENLQKVITVGTLNIQRSARQNIIRKAADTGLLKSKLVPYFKKSEGGTAIASQVGVNLKYAPFVEFGTGPHGKRTNIYPLPPGYSYGSKHHPPPRVLIPWARRHKDLPAFRGMDVEEIAFLVARSIAAKGGLKARPFLFPAFEQHRKDILASVQRVVVDAVRGKS